MRCLLPSVCLVTMFSTGMVVAQTPVAYVYVAQSSPNNLTSPVSAYAAASNGKLTPINGSPFTTEGILIGTNGSQLITLSNGSDPQGDAAYDYVNSYKVGSNGAIEQQLSSIYTQSYSGASCTYASGAELDHTGKYVYVPYCTNAVQTYKIASSGDLTFQNSTIYSDPDQTYGGLPKITGNNAFAYDQTAAETPKPVFVFGAFARASNGTLEHIDNPTVTGPSLPENYVYTVEGSMTNDPTDHLVATLGLLKFTAPSTYTNEGCVLASFTSGSKGQLTSTNTYSKMPAVGCGEAIMLSPSGKYLAVNAGTSLQLFHFNGASPITKFTDVVGTSGYFSAIAWDSDNHLYALNGVSGRLHVYTVTSTKVVEASGSPYDVPYCGYDYGSPNCPQSLVVRSNP